MVLPSRIILKKEPGKQDLFAIFLGYARMAAFTVYGCPRDLAVVTGAAELAIGDLAHIDHIGLFFHDEAQLIVAHGATETYAVEPMGEDHGAHVVLFGKIVDYDIAIFTAGFRCRQEQGGQDRYGWEYSLRDWYCLHVLFTSVYRCVEISLVMRRNHCAS